MIALIVNPAAGRGRAAAAAHVAERALKAIDTVRRYETRQAGDEAVCAERACHDGARVVAVVGGDGSVHHAARGLLRADATGATITPLAIFAAGTGNDFVKSLDIPAHDAAAMAQRIADGGTRLIDVGEIDGIPFVNAAGLGFDVEVLERMQRVRWLSGTAAYVSTALRALIGYRGYYADIHAEEAKHSPVRVHGLHLLTVFANGHTFGGAFHIAPLADLADGELTMVDIGALAPFARPGIFLRATRGTHVGHPAVTTAVGHHFTIASAAPLSFEADGERYVARQQTLHVRINAGALRVVV